jgi:hypothetical protein
LSSSKKPKLFIKFPSPTVFINRNCYVFIKRICLQTFCVSRPSCVCGMRALFRHSRLRIKRDPCLEQPLTLNLCQKQHPVVTTTESDSISGWIHDTYYLYCKSPQEYWPDEGWRKMLTPWLQSPSTKLHCSLQYFFNKRTNHYNPNHASEETISDQFNCDTWLRFRSYGDHPGSPGSNCALIQWTRFANAPMFLIQSQCNIT